MRAESAHYEQRRVYSGQTMKNEVSVEPQTAIHKMVAAARDGREPRVIARLYSGWALFGERQFLRGYTLLLPDPVVPTLNALGSQERAAYLQDVARLGDAVLKLTGAARINYAIYGNVDPALHAHIFPRDSAEPESTRTAQPWALDWNAAPRYSEAEHGALKRRIAADIQARLP